MVIRLSLIQNVRPCQFNLHTKYDFLQNIAGSAFLWLGNFRFCGKSSSEAGAFFIGMNGYFAACGFHYPLYDIEPKPLTCRFGSKTEIENMIDIRFVYHGTVVGYGKTQRIDVLKKLDIDLCIAFTLERVHCVVDYISKDPAHLPFFNGKGAPERVHLQIDLDVPVDAVGELCLQKRVYGGERCAGVSERERMLPCSFSMYFIAESLSSISTRL